MPIETVMLDALDGVQLRADLMRVASATGAVVLTHPHPLYGGDRHNPVVDSLFHALPVAGLTTIRFDFRGVGESGGEHDDGDSERLDVVAAIELLELIDPDAPIWLVGYSFGSIVALNVVDPRVTGWVAIAPPLGDGSRCLAARDHRSKLLLSPDHDQYCPPSGALTATADWQHTEVRPIEMADHFLGGRIAAVTEDVTAHLVR